MLFLMKDNVEPLWEHKNNITGGCWSFKISKGNLKNSWEELSVKLTSETLCKNPELINGISISPKILLINNNLSLEYGSLDGLTKNDMFEVALDNGDKIFLKVAKIEPHNTTLEAISQREKLSLLEGRTAKILSKNP